MPNERRTNIDSATSQTSVKLPRGFSKNRPPNLKHSAGIKIEQKNSLPNFSYPICANDDRGTKLPHLNRCLRPIRVVLNVSYNISIFDEISFFCRNQRGLNLNEYEPQLAPKTIVHPDRTATAAATLAQVIRVVVPQESTLPLGR